MNEAILIWVPVVAMAVEASKRLPFVNGYKEIYSLLSIGFGIIVSVSLGGGAVDGLMLGLAACGGYDVARKAAVK